MAPDRAPAASAAPAGRLRVALFTGNYNYIVDGVSRTLHRVVAHLERQGHRVLVVGSGGGATSIPAPGEFVPAPAFPIPGRPEYRFSTGLGGAARARLAAFAPDVVHVATPDLLGHAALRYARRRGLPVVATFHTHYGSYLRYYRAGWLEPALWAVLRRFYARCAITCVPSRSMLERLRAHGFRGDLRLWARGVDAEAFHPRHRDPAWRRGLGFADTDVVVAFVSRLVREKGLDAFVDAVGGISARGLAHRVLIVGEGPERERLAARLPGAVFTGHLEGAALSRAYASADVFLFPSETETFGNVTLEALASGLPAVCAAATGSGQIVEDGVSGFLAPAAALVAPLARLVGDPGLRAAMGAAARARAETFGWDAALGLLEGCYRDALAARRAR
jgi:glycosyltransferase involved in cell wall biosynthesis